MAVSANNVKHANMLLSQKVMCVSHVYLQSSVLYVWLWKKPIMCQSNYVNDINLNVVI